jgi:hypothetical protein
VTNKTILNLTRAREYVEKGWTQGRWCGPAIFDNLKDYPRVPGACVCCAEGAIFLACGGEGIPSAKDYAPGTEFATALAAFGKAVGLEDDLPNLNAVGMEVNQWNDSTFTTKENVLAAFDRAIEIAGRTKSEVFA